MTHDYCLNNIHIYQFDGDDAMAKTQIILKMFRYGFRTIGGLAVENVLDYSRGLDGLPESDVINYRLAGGSSVIIKPSDTKPELKVYISVKGDSEGSAAAIEQRVSADIESIVYMDDRMGYCCE